MKHLKNRVVISVVACVVFGFLLYSFQRVNTNTIKYTTQTQHSKEHNIFQSYVCTWKNNSKCAYTPTFDDSYLFESHIAVENLLKRNQVKATFFWDVENNTNWNLVDSKLLMNKDFSVQSHTISHPYLTKINDIDKIKELKASKDQLTEHTKQKILVLAYPYYDMNEKVINIAKRYYVTARWGSNNGNNPDGSIVEKNDPAIGINSANTKDYYRIKAMCPNTNTSSEVLNNWLDKAIKNGGWLVTSMHGLSDLFPDSWKSQDRRELGVHYAYAKKKIMDNSVWNDTFENISLYLRERNSVKIETSSVKSSTKLIYSLKLYDNTLDVSLKKYMTFPISVLTYVPSNWDYAEITQNQTKTIIKVRKNEIGNYVIYDVNPQGGLVSVSKGKNNI